MKRSNLKPGYVSILAVLSLTAVLLLSLTASFRSALQNQEIQKKTQLRVDYAHREQALLRAVLTEAPTRAMQCMMADSNNSDWTTKNRWRWIFEYARNRADGEFAVDAIVAAGLGLDTDAISGNIGDGSQDHIVNSVTSTTGESSLHLFYINGGTNSTGTVLGSSYPESLILNDPTIAQLDRDRPLITVDKTYPDGSLYKIIPYPNVHFGYSTQGQNFLAKRNWWAFSIVYGSTSEYLTGVKTVKKDYVLSIYEVPSQLALGSTTMTLLGQHTDGSDWSNVNIQGSVFATRAETQGSISLGSLASREGVTVGGASTVGGIGYGSDQTRETYEAANADFFPMTTSADSGLVAFIPINIGNDGFDDLSNTTDPNRASPTGWNWYSRPAMKAAMRLRVEDVESAIDQTPVRISFTYLSGGIETTEFFERDVNWPTLNSSAGATFPFHLEELEDGRQGLGVYLDRMADYLDSVGADSLDVNNSLAMNVNYVESVNAARSGIPSLATDTAAILRGTKDMTRFTDGFSLVTPMRLYIANDVNVVSTGTDSGGTPVYPPISLFAPEKRFGVRVQAINIDFEGQLNYLGKDENSPIRPLDLKSGVDEEVVPENIRANLFSITDPDRLPPITQMNWLVVIEEVE